ncbi:hypothetical protein MUO83_03015 [Candidatus Bathyarchaeota archaeon]|nr:hypothetical protein [Candidatus Bathyarchaeota archaeon]
MKRRACRPEIESTPPELGYLVHNIFCLLKAQEKVLVNLYARKAEIIFPTLQIDDRVAEYLRETILNYYL